MNTVIWQSDILLIIVLAKESMRHSAASVVQIFIL